MIGSLSRFFGLTQRRLCLLALGDIAVDALNLARLPVLIADEERPALERYQAAITAHRLKLKELWESLASQAAAHTLLTKGHRGRVRILLSCWPIKASRGHPSSRSVA